MIPRTKAPPRPRLAPARILPQNDSLTLTLPYATRAKRPIASDALIVAHARLQHLPAPLASLATAIAARPPGDERMPRDAFGSGPLEFDDELAQEAGVPLVLVRLEQLIGLLVREEVEDQRAQGRGRADVLVQDARVGWRGDGVGRFAEPRDATQDVVAEGRREQAVTESVQVDQ